MVVLVPKLVLVLMLVLVLVLVLVLMLSNWFARMLQRETFMRGNR